MGRRQQKAARVNSHAPTFSKKERSRAYMQSRVVASAPCEPGYEAAKESRSTRSWVSSSAGPNTTISPAIAQIRNRMREIVRNEWSGEKARRSYSANVIGTGITPRFKGPKRKEWRALWDKFVSESDADCVLSFYGQQALVAVTEYVSGEAFVRFRPRRLSDGLAVPMQVQVMEGDCVPWLNADAWPGLPPGNVIRSGIEINPFGRRTAVWFYKWHPGEQAPSATPGFNDITRVPAENVAHIFMPTRPGQLRGVSRVASVARRIHQSGDFENAVLTRMAIANLFAMFITEPDENGDPMFDDGQNDPSGTAVAVEPGITHKLLPGEDVKFSDPPDAGANFAEFTKHSNQTIAAGYGLPYEILTGDAGAISDRVLRILIQEWRRGLQQDQWLMHIPMFCERAMRAFAAAAVLSGTFSQRDADEALPVTWSPQRWEYMHPVQDVQAVSAQIDAGLTSRSEEIAARGDDPEEVDAQRKSDKDREDKLGLTMLPPKPTGGTPGTTSQ